IAVDGYVIQFLAIAYLLDLYVQLALEDFVIGFAIAYRCAVPERIVERTVVAVPVRAVMGMAVVVRPVRIGDRFDHAYVARIDTVLKRHLQDRTTRILRLDETEAGQFGTHQVFVILVFEIVLLIGFA